MERMEQVEWTADRANGADGADGTSTFVSLKMDTLWGLGEAYPNLSFFAISINFFVTVYDFQKIKKYILMRFS